MFLHKYMLECVLILFLIRIIIKMGYSIIVIINMKIKQMAHLNSLYFFKKNIFVIAFVIAASLWFLQVMFFSKSIENCVL